MADFIRQKIKREYYKRGMHKTKIFQEKKKTSLFSVLVNLFLSVMKIGGGMVSGSASLTADGIHSLSDFAASLSVYTGVIIANKKSKFFPHGLYKVENLVALASAFAIFFAGYEIAKDVLFEDPQPITHLPVALGVLTITVVTTFLYAQWEKKKAKELNSPSLLADAEHVKADFYTALVVLVGVLGQYFGYPMIEKIAVAVVIYFIFHAGFSILKESIKVLLDASLDYETIERVKEVVSRNPHIQKIHKITGRNAGSYKFVQLDIDLDTDSLKEAHVIAHQIEDAVKEQVPFIEKVLVHFE